MMDSARLFNLIERSCLYRSLLNLIEVEDPSAHRHSWDLGYHHAKRGKSPEPNNPAVRDPKAYMAGYQTSKGETAAKSREGQEERPEQDIEPSMRLSLDDVPESVGRVASAIGQAGGRALLIGGAVRDKIMGKSPKDFDIEVYGLDPDRLEHELSKLGQVDAVGKSFGVLKIVIGDEDFDVSVPRRESKVGQGHKGFIPKPDPTMTITEAARRRDFTMNTVAMDPHTGDVFDPFGGVEDIKNRVLRATDPTAFKEDPLRILRGAQFAARFGMNVDPNTMRLMQEAGDSLAELPRERVGAEWNKLLMKGEKPSIGLDVLKKTGALRVLHPDLDELSETPQDPEFHPEGDAWTHTKMVVDRAVELTKELGPEDKKIIRFAALMHDIAKPATTTHDEDGRIRSRGHEEAGGKMVAETLHEKFDVPKDMTEKIANLVTDHLKPTIFYLDRDNVTDRAIRRLAKRLYPANIDQLTYLAHADHTGRGQNGPQDFPAGPWLLQKAVDLNVVHEPPAPILMGRHLIPIGVKPGPQMGQILNKVFELQLDGRVTDLDGAISAAKRIASQLPQQKRPDKAELRAKRKLKLLKPEEG